MNEILISVNLPGILGGRVKHTHKQSFTVDISPLGEKPKLLTSKILHTNREVLPCTKEIHISVKVLQNWLKEKCPYWEKPQQWKKFSEEQKIQSYVNTFDEGWGVTYQ